MQVLSLLSSPISLLVSCSLSLILLGTGVFFLAFLTVLYILFFIILKSVPMVASFPVDSLVMNSLNYQIPIQHIFLLYRHVFKRILVNAKK